MNTTLTRTNASEAPIGVEASRDGILYEIRIDGVLAGYVAQIGFYANTWSLWTAIGSFLGEFDSRKAAIADLTGRLTWDIVRSRSEQMRALGIER